MANTFQFGVKTNTTPFAIRATVQTRGGSRGQTMDLHLIPPSTRPVFGKGGVEIGPEPGKQVKDQIIRFNPWEVDELRNLLRANPPVRWRSVKSEHPTENGWYLVFDTRRAGPSSLLSSWRDGEWRGPVLEPSHWQPLPAPPRD